MMPRWSRGGRTRDRSGPTPFWADSVVLPACRGCEPEPQRKVKLVAISIVVSTHCLRVANAWFRTRSVTAITLRSKLKVETRWDETLQEPPSSYCEVGPFQYPRPVKKLTRVTRTRRERPPTAPAPHPDLEQIRAVSPVPAARRGPIRAEAPRALDSNFGREVVVKRHHAPEKPDAPPADATYGLLQAAR